MDRNETGLFFFFCFQHGKRLVGRGASSVNRYHLCRRKVEFAGCIFFHRALVENLWQLFLFFFLLIEVGK